MYPKGRLHLVLDPLFYRAKRTEVPFGQKEVGRYVGDRHMENRWKMASIGAHYARY